MSPWEYTGEGQYRCGAARVELRSDGWHVVGGAGPFRFLEGAQDAACLPASGHLSLPASRHPNHLRARARYWLARGHSGPETAGRLVVETGCKPDVAIAAVERARHRILRRRKAQERAARVANAEMGGGS